MQDGTEIRVSVKTVEIKTPLMVGEMPGYKSRNVSLKFDPDQLDSLYRLFHALNLSHATLRNGKTAQLHIMLSNGFWSKLENVISNRRSARERIRRDDQRPRKKSVSKNCAVANFCATN